MDQETLIQLRVIMRSIESNAESGTMLLRRVEENAPDQSAIDDAQDYFWRIKDLMQEMQGQYWNE
jgi:hypothetical protein